MASAVLLQRFLTGLCPEISRQLLLHQKPADFTAALNDAVDTLKTKLTTLPVLAFPQFEIPFIVATDASDYAVGGVLSRVQDGHESHCILKLATTKR